MEGGGIELPEIDSARNVGRRGPVCVSSSVLVSSHSMCLKYVSVLSTKSTSTGRFLSRGATTRYAGTEKRERDPSPAKEVAEEAPVLPLKGPGEVVELGAPEHVEVGVAADGGKVDHPAL